MNIFTIFLSICFSVSSYANVYSHNYLQGYSENSILDVGNTFEFDTSNNSKKITSIRIGVFLDKNPQLRNLNISINNQNYKLNIPIYERGRHELQEFELRIKPISQKDIKKFTIQFPQKALVAHLSLYFKDKYQGKNLQKQFLRTKKMALHRLYEQDFKDPINTFTRSRGIRDLSYFPSYESLEVLREIIDYDPPYNDYENDYIARDVFKEVTKKIALHHGEEKLAEYLALIFEDTSDRLIENQILNTLYDFKTSAALFFGIKYHIYSPLTERRINHDSILESIYQKSDFNKYVQKYFDLIIEEIFIYHEGRNQWDMHRACDVFNKSPQKGLFKILYPLVAQGDHSTRFHCGTALVQVFKKLNIIDELTHKDILDAKEIILEKFKVGQTWFDSGYSYEYQVRELAIYILNESHEVETLKLALKNPKLEKDLRDTIKRLIK